MTKHKAAVPSVQPHMQLGRVEFAKFIDQSGILRDPKFVIPSS